MFRKNILLTGFQAIALLFLCASCNTDTGSLGYSTVPEDDYVETFSNEFYAKSKTVIAPDSLISKSQTMYLGCYSDPTTNTKVKADFISQFNCRINFEFPDSVYGVDRFSFPDWFEEEMQGQSAFKTRLVFYYTTYFGDPNAPVTFNVRELDTIIDGSKPIYQRFEPKEYCDTLSAPLGTFTISTQDYNVSDSIRNLDTYYPTITVALPDSIAESIIKHYYSPNGKKDFADAWTFINNICPGYYIEYVDGEGVMFCFDRVILELGFSYINPEGKMETAYAQFPGNNEVMQVNKFYNTGLEQFVLDNTATYLKSPFGLMTEIDLPIDNLIGIDTILNEAKITFNCYADYDYDYSHISKPGYLLLMQKNALSEYFNSSISLDNTRMFYAAYDSKFNNYVFNNITSLIEAIALVRELWFMEQGLSGTEEDKEAYEQMFPDWNKLLLVPVKARYDSNNSIVSFTYNDKVTFAKLKGGIAGDLIKIKTIHCYYHQ